MLVCGSTCSLTGYNKQIIYDTGRYKYNGMCTWAHSLPAPILLLLLREEPKDDDDDEVERRIVIMITSMIG